MTTNIALLGAGIFAKEAYIPALFYLLKSKEQKKDLNVSLYAVYSRSRSSAASLAALARKQLGQEDGDGDKGPLIYYDVDESHDAGVTTSASSSNDLDALLKNKNIHAVIIALPITLQPSIIIRALENGKHVLSEKPVAPSVKEGLELIGKYEKEFRPKNLIWRVAENWEAEPAYRRLAQLTSGAGASSSVFSFGESSVKESDKDKKIGKVQFFRLTAVNYVDLDGKWYKTPWRTIPDYQGGFLLDGGVHSACLLRLFLPSGAQPGEVSAHASLTREHLKPLDTVSGVIGCSPVSASNDRNSDTRTHGIFELSFGAPAPSRASADKGGGGSLTITGDKGWVKVESVRVGDKPNYKLTIHSVTKAQEREGDVLEEEESIEVYEAKGVEVEVYAFLKSVAGDITKHSEGYLSTLGSPQEALKDVAIIEACLTSNGRPIDLRKLVGDT